MLKDSVKLTGKLSIKKFNERDELVYETTVPNLVVNVGKAFIASRIISDSDYPIMNYMGIGTDASTVAVTQTALVVENARVEVNTATAVDANVTFTGIFPAGVGTGSIVEAAIYNQPSTKVFTFDGDNGVNATSHIIGISSHGFTTGDKVTYVDGGGTTVGQLVDGATYYVIYVDADHIQLANSLVNAEAENAIAITDGSGSNHKIIYGEMLCRTTFPVISKSGSETIAISWVVTVG
jgi:hypothetical protein